MQIHSTVPQVLLGWVQIEGIQVWESSTELKEWMKTQEALASENWEAPSSQKRREAVRAMLRKAGYKASGRNKPAQEYLMRCVREGTGLPSIYPAVDVLNATSIRLGLPISILQRNLFPEGQVHLRIGKTDESYTFNSVGQTLDLENLVVVCGGKDGEIPLGTPIKDSLLGKIGTETKDAFAFLYGPVDCIESSEMLRIAQEFAIDLKKWTEAESISSGVIRCEP